MKISTEQHTLAATVLELSGRLDALEAPALRQQLESLTDADGPALIVVDLSNVEFVDSAGLAALVKGMKNARQSGGDLRLVSPSNSDAMRVFQLTKFDKVFAMSDTAAEAMRGW